MKNSFRLHTRPIHGRMAAWLPALCTVLPVFFSCGKTSPVEPLPNEVISTSLSFPTVTSIAEDATGHIWIGTSRGLNRDLTYGYHQYFAAADSLSLQDDHIKTIFPDRDGRLWVAGSNGTLSYLSQEGTFRQVDLPFREKARISFAQTEDGGLLCDNEFDICRYDPATEQMVPFIEGSVRNEGCFVRKNELTVVYADSVSRFDATTGRRLFSRQLPSPCNRAATAGDGTIWLSVGKEGSLRILRSETLEPMEVPPVLAQALEGESLIQILPDDREENILLIGTRRDILFYDSAARTLRTTRERGFTLDLESYDINCIFLDSGGNVWIGTDGGGIRTIRNIHRWSRFQILVDYCKAMPVAQIRFDGKTGALHLANHRGEQFSYHLSDMTITEEPSTDVRGKDNAPFRLTRTLTLRDGRMLTVNDDKDLLISSAHGDVGYMIPVNKAKEALDATHFVPVVLYQDSRQKIWIGTKSNGVTILDPDTNTFLRVPDITCQDISSIIEDKLGNIWVATKNGLNVYTPDGSRINCFTGSQKEGDQAYMEGSTCMMPDGVILFGTMRGLVIVDPKLLTRQPTQETLTFEDLRVRNAIVRPGKEAPIQQAMVYSPPIRLRHDQNTFSISYTLLNYRNSIFGTYSYKLEGLDKAWNESGNAHEAFYSNVPPGHYTFRVRMSRSNGAVYGSAACDITVVPAPWASWYAKTLYLLLGTALLSLILYTYLRHKRNKEHLDRVNREKQQEQQMNDIIKKYFANVAHQLRTPLTMITGPVDTLYASSGLSGKDRELLQILHYNSKRMLDLVNQIMDFHSLESDALALKVRRCDIIQPLTQALALYRFHAEAKHISFLTNGLDGNVFVWGDVEKITTILDNLLSNAFKFTPENGVVSVSFATNGQQAQLDVSNSGSSIPEDRIEAIFKRFYQIRSEGGEAVGSGVGLYYARKLAGLHHGTLTCRNEENGEGVCFTLRIPVGKDAFRPEEIDDGKARGTQAAGENILPETGATANSPSEDSSVLLKSAVLVVDDDPDITFYLKTLLEPRYKVRCCYSAESALGSLEKDAPDLIISDVMMPGQSGLTFCNHLKGDLQYCHIPLILLTAKDQVQDQIEGLAAGADAYVTKPFHAEYLVSVVDNLIKGRARLRKSLSENAGIPFSGDTKLSPQDKAFLDQLYALWEEQFSDPEFNIGAIVDQLHISHTKFIYKVKGLTGYTPSELFKNFKLNKAAAMLRDHRYNVSEVADLTGFGTLANFSRAFKKKFGVPPSEFK